jgi:hypothetical protein
MWAEGAESCSPLGPTGVITPQNTIICTLDYTFGGSDAEESRRVIWLSVTGAAPFSRFSAKSTPSRFLAE